ncbi:hypothetical protein CD351_04070 [Erythrobacter sp. KY5]|nr:hypothetical protein CD351_04070 [Erythrobacter sp. KY5]
MCSKLHSKPAAGVDEAKYDIIARALNANGIAIYEEHAFSKERGVAVGVKALPFADLRQILRADGCCRRSRGCDTGGAHGEESVSRCHASRFAPHSLHES